MGQGGRYNCTLIVIGSHITISLYHAADRLRITHFHVALHYYSNYLLSRMFAVVKKSTPALDDTWAMLHSRLISIATSLV